MMMMMMLRPRDVYSKMPVAQGQNPDGFDVVNAA